MRGQATARLFEVVRQRGGTFTADEAAAVAGFDLITTAAAIAALTVDGRVVRVNTAKPARYEVPDHSRQLGHTGVRATPGPHPAFGFVCGRAA